jgi:hypothetical protein
MAFCENNEQQELIRSKYISVRAMSKSNSDIHVWASLASYKSSEFSKFSESASIIYKKKAHREKYIRLKELQMYTMGMMGDLAKWTRTNFKWRFVNPL